MEGLTRLVSESLARHGFETPLDHRRLQWSRWFRCESSFSFLLVPSQPGLFALGEEMIPPGELPATGGKRMLALFRISEAEDLGMEMGRMFAPHSPLRERFAQGRCFARYVVVEDQIERRCCSRDPAEVARFVGRNGVRCLRRLRVGLAITLTLDGYGKRRCRNAACRVSWGGTQAGSGRDDQPCSPSIRFLVSKRNGIYGV
jgi:hypothetical protein